MKSNAAAAAAFQEIADLLDVLGEKFKPEAYRRAARSIESLTEDLSAVAARDQLRAIPGVGDAIEEKIREFLRDGTIPYLERLRHDVPAGVVAMMRLEGIGPKTARKFWTDLGVETPDALREAIDAGRLAGVKGFGPTKIAKVRAAVGAAAAGTGRRPILAAALVAERIVAALQAQAPVTQIEV
ncbi:MAG: helix-hairpin-helix domain-containing protein, partial [Thermoplasmata archaeon]|nr:helix-hairpin-helix domain-containing protein [Thermoplasmata archaeon]